MFRKEEGLVEEKRFQGDFGDKDRYGRGWGV